MLFLQTDLPEVLRIIPKAFKDERGFFMETYKKSLFTKAGIPEFVQENHSESVQGVLRGIHYQLNPKAQGKLVRCVKGKVWDVAVDLRKDSPNFGRWIGFELSEENQEMLWIPEGFGHGFITLSEKATFLYKTTAEYSPEHDRGIRFDDPALNILWPKVQNIDFIISEKDKKLPFLDHAEIF